MNFPISSRTNGGIPLSRVITKRIKALNDTALEFAGGRLSRRADIAGHDEIAELGITFNLMADKISKMIRGNKELMANVSHELRSPLARIRVSAELILENIGLKSKADIERYMRHIDQDIDTLDELIDQILKLSKMEYRKAVGARQEINLHSFLAVIEKKFFPVLEQKQIKLVKQIEPDLLLHADVQELETIFSNLLDNAVKYTDEKQKIYLEAGKTHAKAIWFAVSNPYRKLTPDELAHLFDPFFRLDRDSRSGSGLGLTIVKKMLQQNNGTISAVNSDRGLQFKLEFTW